MLQECIPVGCVPSAAVAVSWREGCLPGGGVVCPGGVSAQGVCPGWGCLAGVVSAWEGGMSAWGVSARHPLPCGQNDRQV